MLKIPFFTGKMPLVFCFLLQLDPVCLHSVHIAFIKINIIQVMYFHDFKVFEELWIADARNTIFHWKDAIGILFFVAVRSSVFTFCSYSFHKDKHYTSHVLS